MNSHCSVCDVEPECGYEYKPCDCCNYRKFKPKVVEAIVIEFLAHRIEQTPTEGERNA